MSKLLRVRPVVVVVCAIGLLSAAVGVGLAATRSGTIHACANKKSGALRLATGPRTGCGKGSESCLNRARKRRAILGAAVPVSCKRAILAPTRTRSQRSLRLPTPHQELFAPSSLRDLRAIGASAP